MSAGEQRKRAAGDGHHARASSSSFKRSDSMEIFSDGGASDDRGDEYFLPAELCDDLLCCVICFERFTESRTPKALPCLHTFCKPCLAKTVRKAVRRSTGNSTCSHPPRPDHLYCPVCKDKSRLPENGVDGYKDDFRVRKLCDALEVSRAAPRSGSDSEGRRMCVTCPCFGNDVANAEQYCLQCGSLLCDSCAEKHLATSVSAGHVLLASSNAELESHLCRAHKEQIGAFYCKDCAECICVACSMLEPHASHEQLSISEEAKLSQKKLQQLNWELQQKLPQLEEQLKQLEKLEAELKARERRAGRAILLQTIGAMKKLRDEQGRREAELASVGAARLQQLRSARALLDDSLQWSRDTVRLSTALVEHGTPHQMVAQQRRLSNALKPASLTGETSVGETSVGETSVGETSVGETSVGETSVGETSVGDLSGVLDLGKFNEMVEVDEDGRSDEDEGDPRVAVMHDMRAVVAEMRACNRAWNVQTVGVAGSKGSGNCQFNFPSGVAILPNGRIVVADFQNERVQILEPDGKFVSKFSVEKMKPCGVAALADGSLVVTDCHRNCLRLFDQNGCSQGVIGQFLFDFPFSVGVDTAGRFVVSDPAINRITILSASGKLVKRFHSRTKFAFYLCTTLSDDILLSDWYHHCVKMFDKSGRLLREIGGEGRNPGQFMVPLGLCADQRGNVIVLDCKLRRVTMFSSDGKLQTILLTAEQNIDNCRAVALGKDGRLVISHGDNKKLVANDIRIFQIY